MLSPTLLHSFLHFSFYLYFRTKSILVVVAISVEVPVALEEFAHFHDVDGVRSCIKALIQPNNVLMPGPLEYVVLLHDLLQRALVRHVGLIGDED